MANAEAVEIDGIYYNLVSKIKEATVIRNPNGYSGDLIIPSKITYEGIEYNVLIGNSAFNGSNLSSLTISNGVSISDDAFRNCNSYSIVLHCKAVGKWFNNNSFIKEITLGEGVESVAEDAFSNSQLTSVTIGESVSLIGANAFNYCRNLNSVFITDIDAWCRIIFKNSMSNPLYCARYFVLNGNYVKNLVIPNSVESIGNYAFYGYKGLISVIIPNTITTIGNYAFDNCKNLETVTFNESVTSIGSQAFSDCTSLTSVHITDIKAWCEMSFNDPWANPLFYAHHLFFNGEELNNLIIPNSVTSIRDYTFSYCKSLTSVTIPNSVVSIGGDAFQGCSGITSLDIPNSVVSIGGHAFSGCSGITSLTIPNNINKISYGLFYGCTSLKDVIIPNNIETIESSAFSGCTSLKTISIGHSIKNIGQNAFSRCTDLIDVYCFAKTVPNTAANAFSDSYVGYTRLHVPDESASEYQETTPWNEFNNVSTTMNYYCLTYLVDGVVYKSYDVESNTTIDVEEIPQKEGYTFSGWSEIPETMPAHDVTITGSFIVNKYNLIYKVDDADYKTYEIEYGTTITPEPVPTKVGYIFAGWSEIPATMPDHDVTVSGIFIPKTYLPGDANGDGQITVTDIGVIVDIILGKTPTNARKQQEEEPQ